MIDHGWTILLLRKTECEFKISCGLNLRGSSLEFERVVWKKRLLHAICSWILLRNRSSNIAAFSRYTYICIYILSALLFIAKHLNAITVRKCKILWPYVPHRNLYISEPACCTLNLTNTWLARGTKHIRATGWALQRSPAKLATLALHYNSPHPPPCIRKKKNNRTFIFPKK